MRKNPATKLLNQNQMHMAFNGKVSDKEYITSNTQALFNQTIYQTNIDGN